MARLVLPEPKKVSKLSTDSVPETDDMLTAADFRYRWNSTVRKPHMKAENLLLGKVGQAQHVPRYLVCLDEKTNRVPSPATYVRNYVVPSMLVQRELVHTGQQPSAAAEIASKERVRKRKNELRANIDLTEVEIEAREALYEMRISELARVTTQVASVAKRGEEARELLEELTDRREVLTAETRELARVIHELNKKLLVLTQEMENDPELKRFRTMREYEKRRLLESRVNASEQIMHARLGAADLTELIVVNYIAQEQQKIEEQAVAISVAPKKKKKQDEDDDEEEEEEEQLVRRSRAQPGIDSMRVSPTEFRMLWNTQVRERAVRIARLLSSKQLETLADGIVEFGRDKDNKSVPKPSELQSTYWKTWKRFQDAALDLVFATIFPESEYEACIERLRQSRRAAVEKIQRLRREIAALQLSLEFGQSAQQDAARGFAGTRRGGVVSDEAAARRYRELVLEQDREQQVTRSAIGRLSRQIVQIASEQVITERRILEECEREERELRARFSRVMAELTQLDVAVAGVVNAITYAEVGAAELLDEEESVESESEVEEAIDEENE